MANYPDTQLVTMLKSNQRILVNKALNQIMKQHQATAMRVLQSKSMSLEDAEEIFSEGLLVLVDNARKDLLNKPKVSIKPYIIRICKNKAWNRAQDKRDFEDFNSAEVKNTISELDTLDHLFDKERRVWIEGLLQQMGEKCQELLKRFYWSRQNMKTIAQQMGYANAQVARNKKNRCMNKLRNLGGWDASPFLD